MKRNKGLKRNSTLLQLKQFNLMYPVNYPMVPSKELRIGNLITWNPKLLNSRSTLPPIYIEVHEILQDKVGYVFPNIENRVEPSKTGRIGAYPFNT
jgi:hypothetical protein